MIDSVLYAVGSACLAVTWIGSGIHICIKRMIWGYKQGAHRLKPFDCAMCMGWWFGIVSGIYFVKSPAETIYIGAMSFVLSIVLTKYLNR